MAIKDLLGKALGLVPGGNVVKTIAGLIGEYAETPAEKRAAEKIANNLVADSDKVQAAVNQAEAAHRSIFVAGWRPAIGWICVFAFGVRYVAAPLAAMFGVVGPEYSAADWGDLSTVLYGLLGLGTLRTVEKRMGVSR